MKRFLSLLLFAILIGSSAIAYDFSAVCSSGQTLYYTIISNAEPYTVQVVPKNASSPYYSTNPTGDLVIPTSVTNSGKTYSVTSIGAYAFNSCSGITSVTIPNTITSIGQGAFSSCGGLTELTIPESITNIEDRAFSNCYNLATVNFNATNCTHMGNYDYNNPKAVFYSCHLLTTINIGENVTNIPNCAFNMCTHISVIEIPNTVTNIGWGAFESCSGLETVTIGRAVTQIGVIAFYQCVRLTTINFNATNCTIMGNSNSPVFNKCNTSAEINIGSDVETIPDYAFNGIIGLGDLTIPNSVTNIGHDAFSGCSGFTGTLTIPNSVTSIGSEAFKNCSGLTSVTIPNSVTSIESSAFSGCSGLSGTLIIPNSVETIGNSAFSNCRGITSVTISNTATNIGNNVFSGCTGLSEPVYNTNSFVYFPNGYATEYTIPDGILQIAGGAFRECSDLTSITIPESITSIGTNAFSDCSGLTTINFNATNCMSVNNSFYNCTSLSTINIGENVTNIPACAFAIKNSNNSITYLNLREINYNAVNCTIFESNNGISGNTNITTLNIGENVTYIPPSAFYNCSGLTGTLTIPNSVTNIGAYAFRECNNITLITIPSAVTSIGNYAFQNCTGLTTLNFNATNCTSMGSSSNPVFSGCTALQTLNIGENVTNIPACAFYNCNRLSSITIPSAVTNIGNSAFQNCTGITSINFNATNCTSMGSSSSPAFSGCTALQTINIGNNVTNIPAYAFKGCSGFSSITIPTNVQGIGEYAFQGCTGLEAISIPSSVTSIGASALGGCSGLTSVTIPYIGNRADVTATDTYRYPLGYLFGTSSYSGGSSVSQSYYGSSASSTTSSTYYIPSSLRSVTVLDGYIPYGAFQNCSMLTSITIPSSITSIEGNTFYGCSGLSSITIPNTVTSIGANAFYNCSNIANVSLPSAVTNIGASAFYNCNHITSITIPNAVTSIGNSAFQNCTGLTTLNFNATNCTSMGSSSNPTFSGCTALQTINIGNNVTNIPAYAFYNCNRLSSITIPNAVTSIGNSAFQNCTGITSVNYNATNCTSMGSSSYPVFGSCNANATISIGANVTRIPAYAFNGLRGSGTLNIPETVTSIGDYAFSACSGISTANLPNALQSIPVGLFYECSGLRSVNIPTSASSIGNYAFYGCNNLNGSIAIPNSVTSIGTNAFYNCNSIPSLSIGSAVSSIGSNAFYNCSGLSSITVDASNTTYDSRDNCNAIITKSNNSLLLGCNNTVIPETIRSIGSSAFYNCRSLRRVNIPQQLTSLGNDAFAGCSAISEVVVNATSLNSNYTQSPFSAAQTSLKKIGLGEGVTRLPNYMFAGCTALDTIIANPTVPPTIYSSTFDYNHVSSTRVIVPCRTADIYSDADFWYNFRRIKQNEPCPTIYTVTALSNNNLFGTVTGGGDYEENSIVTLSATANYGYRFVAWNDGNEENPRTISVTNDVTYIATFVEIPPVATYTITALSSNPTIGVVTGGGSYYEGTEVTLTATPSEGYAFVSWNDGETLNPRQITVSGDAMYIASFIVASVVTNYEVSVASSNLAYGTVSGSGTYSLGNVVTISATAFDGYMFTSWNDGNTDNPRSITVIGDAMYVANFAVIPPTPVYTLTVLSINNAYGAVSGGGEYEENAVATLTATPNEGYEFTSWSDGSTDNPHEVTVTRNAMYVAYFDELPQTPTYNITVIASNPNHGSVTGGGVYEANAEVTLTATAFEGYRFDVWSDGSTENPRSITVTSDAMYVANFVEIPETPVYTLTVLSINNAYGTVSGGGEYEENAVATLTATPNEGYEFTSWSDGSTDNPHEVTVTRNAMYVAYFDEILQTPTYNITVIASNPNHGSVTGSGEYEENAEVTLTATAFDGYRFDVWSDGSTDSIRTITVTSDAMYVANFVEIPETPVYTLTVLSINNAYGAVSGGGEYEGNAVATLTATPNDGYEFTSWSDGSTDNPHEVTVTRNAMYVAYFDELPQAPTYNITVIASNPNHGSVTGGGVYEANAEVTLTATAFDGYRFDIWSDGSTDNPRNITVTSDAMYVANFVENPETPVYTLTVLSINNAYGSVSGGGEYEENAVATLTATANDGYEFTSWSDGSTDNPHEVTVTHDAMYVAYFDELPQTPTYNITVIASNPNHGSVTGGGVYEANAEVTLTATAFEGYRFDVWSDGSTDSIRTITVTSDAIYIANFVRIDDAQTIYVTVVDTACGSYTWNNVTYTESGTYYRTFTAANSADSIVALGLVILPLPEPIITVDGILDACNQESTSVTLSAGNYSSYSWTTGETSSSIVVTTPGEYYVEVVDSMGCQGISEGVIVGYSTVLTEAPQIRNLGMNSNGYISLNWTVAQTEGVAGYEVYREDNETNVFRLVKRINNARTKLLIDSAADPSARAYRYKVCAIDSCGGMSPMSEPHKTMHLTINQGIDNTWNLIWSHYEGFELRGYKIIRGTTMANMVEIDVVPSNLNSYTDYSNPYNLGFFYKVMIIKDTRSNDEEEEMLSSNIVDNGHIVMRTVMAAASNPVCGAVSGSGVYADGTEIVIEATANEGYEFLSWNDGSTQNPRNAIITSDTLFIANFVEIPQVATYNIMVYSSNPAYGTVTGGGTYPEGTEITIAATAGSGYEFVSWSDGSSENPRTLIVTEDAMYIATFVETSSVVSYTITVISANPTQGIVTGGGTYPEGTVITIEAIANDGYEFISWNDNSIDNPREITVTADAMYIATFVPASDIEESATTEINVFPNPANDILNITSSETISEIEIVNVMGQIVRRMEVNSDNAVCDVEELTSGVYVVRIRTASATLSQRKFVKE